MSASVTNVAVRADRDTHAAGARGRPPCAGQVSPRPREMAISPVRAISIRPNGRTIRSKASILSQEPVTSMITDRLETSMILPRKISTICMTSAREAPSAATLKSASSRATVSVGSRSRILMTLTSLWSCLVTWSIGCIAPSSVSVMRESVGSSVGPTASVSMLKPRRANSPAMRVSTPGLFSTRIERMCLRPVRRPTDASSSSSDRTSLVPGSPMRSAHHFPGRGARRDHRVHVRLARALDVDDDGARRGQSGAEVVLQGVLVRQEHARRPVGLGELDPVRPLAHVDVRVTPVPEELLPLADHAEVAVVHDHALDRDVVLAGGRELLD